MQLLSTAATPAAQRKCAFSHMSTKKMVNSCNNSSTHSGADLKNSQLHKQMQRIQGTLLIRVPECRTAYPIL
jgi:hypothetical protein